MYEEDFTARLTSLRKAKGVSARDMSLTIGLNAGYISNLETGRCFPSMEVFFYICYYFGISPVEFFDVENPLPAEVHALTEKIKHLRPDQIHLISQLVDQLQ